MNNISIKGQILVGNFRALDYHFKGRWGGAGVSKWLWQFENEIN